MKLEKQLPYKHKIYKILKSEILNGRYSPGEVLNERSLSEELGISRTPIREALQMLAQDGWVSIETYKGAVVRELDLRNMKEFLLSQMKISFTWRRYIKTKAIR